MLKIYKISFAFNQANYLLTVDIDFGEMVFRQKLVHSGVILMRLSGLANSRKAEIVAKAFRDHFLELRNHFSVISLGQIRIRE